MERMKNCKLALAIMITVLSFLANAEVECRTCKDEGVIYEKCPLCRGSRYMWTCSAESSARTYWNGSSYRQTDPDAQYCGYGSTYKPLHKGCKATRKRINCPDCAKGKTKSVSTGKIAKVCPVCHGRGKEVEQSDGVYYVIRDASYITDQDREYVFLQMDKPVADGRSAGFSSRIFKKAMAQQELSDYKAVYPKARVFESLEEMKDFLRKNPNGTANASTASSQPSVFIVKDAMQITANDRRIVFEELGNGYSSYSSRNIMQRRFTDQDVEDFKLINPRCRVFETLSELKAFMRTAKVIDSDQEFVAPPREPRRAIQQSTTTPVTTSGGRRKALTMEELDERIKAEMEHEKEMLKRRLGE